MDESGPAPASRAARAGIALISLALLLGLGALLVGGSGDAFHEDLVRLSAPREKVKPPVPPAGVLVYEFDRAGDAEGWTFIDGAADPVVPEVSGGRLRVACRSLDIASDPRLRLTLPQPLAANRVSSAILSLSIEKGNKRPQLRWKASSDPSEAGWSRATFAVPLDGKSHAVSVPLGDRLDWIGAIGSLEITLPLAAGRVEVDWIRFEYEPPEIPAAFKAEIGSESRNAMRNWRPAPFTARTLPVRVRRGMTLRFGYGVLGRSWKSDEHGGCRFVAAIEPCGAPPETLLDDTLRPGAIGDHRRWFDASFDLSRFSGLDATIVFRTEPLPGSTRPEDSLGIFSEPTLSTPQLFRGRTPVILVSLDTLRADHLRRFGYDRDTAPNLEALFASGTLFANAMSQAPETLASHMSLMTGLYPSTHKVAGENDALAPGVMTLACRFREANFVTAAVTEGGMVQSAYGFDAGFDRYDDGVPPEPGTGGNAERTFRVAGDIAESLRDVPFFLFVHTYEIHAPYAAPAAYRGIFGPTPPDLGSKDFPITNGFTIDEMYRLNGLPTPPTADQARILATLYDEEIRYTDAELGRFLERLRDAGLLDRVVLAVTSDHGEEFMDRGPEHGAVAWHGHTLNEELIHVPLVVKGPRGVPAGRRVARVVSMFDLHPTLLDLGGAPLKHPDEIQATSLAPLFASDSRPGEDAAVSEDLTTFVRHSIRTPAFRYVWTERMDRAREGIQWDFANFPPALRGLERFLGTYEPHRLYDHALDPRETHDLAGTRPELVGEFNSRLEPLIQAFPNFRVRSGCLDSPSRNELDIDRLRQLGYVR